MIPTRTARPGSERRAHRKHVTRRELLAAGRKLFGEQGLYDCRIEDLSRNAGIAKGTLYGYFASKEALMASVVTSALDELLDRVQREARAARSYRGRLERVARAHLEFYEANPDLMRILHQVRGLLKFDRPEGAALRPVLARYLVALSRALALPLPRRPRRAPHPREAALALFGAAAGVVSIQASVPGLASSRLRSAALARALAALVLACGPRRVSR